MALLPRWRRRARGQPEIPGRLPQRRGATKAQAAASTLVEAPLFIDDTAGIHLMEIHAKLPRTQAEHSLGLVIVDYLQLMTGRGRFENRNQEITAISRGLKLLAKVLDVPLLVLSQLNRAPETRPGDHRPQLSDLRPAPVLGNGSSFWCRVQNKSRG